MSLTRTEKLAEDESDENSLENEELGIGEPVDERRMRGVSQVCVSAAQDVPSIL